MPSRSFLTLALVAFSIVGADAKKRCSFKTPTTSATSDLSTFKTLTTPAAPTLFTSSSAVDALSSTTLDSLSFTTTSAAVVISSSTSTSPSVSNFLSTTTAAAVTGSVSTSTLISTSSSSTVTTFSTKSSDPPSAASGSNILQDGDFEGGAGGRAWTFTAQSSGLGSVRASQGPLTGHGGSEHYFFIEGLDRLSIVQLEQGGLNIKGGHLYTLEYHYAVGVTQDWGLKPSPECRINAFLPGSITTLGPTTNVTPSPAGSWFSTGQRTFTAPLDSDRFRFIIACTIDVEHVDILLDNISLVESAASPA